VVASAPKAEVGFSPASLLSGRPRAERLNLVGGRACGPREADGKVTVSTGVDQRPLAVAPAPLRAGHEEALRRKWKEGFATTTGAAEGSRSLQENFAAFLAWVDSLGAFGLDGGDLTEVGLKSGNLVVDDHRNGQQSRFETFT